ncbi:hypothetical protein EC973_001349 [Apophysomyces ossiformis]|uniref:Uncharacterized protein n=1 Tax=Apophysomyces ossiformis TaxID=679940 RepID=A0A8H7ES88_9FUNG|nr:hypothetical protein EC973_001349 [Apophysomyces ossiformis]
MENNQLHYFQHLLSPYLQHSAVQTVGESPSPPLQQPPPPPYTNSAAAVAAKNHVKLEAGPPNFWSPRQPHRKGWWKRKKQVKQPSNALEQEKPSTIPPTPSPPAAIVPTSPASSQSPMSWTPGSTPIPQGGFFYYCPPPPASIPPAYTQVDPAPQQQRPIQTVSNPREITRDRCIIM